MQNPWGILRIVYTVQSYLPDVEADKSVYCVKSDGSVTISRYKRGSSKRVSSVTRRLQQSDVLALYEQLYACARNVDGFVTLENDHSGSLAIHYQYPNMETLDSGLCGNGTTIGEIMDSLIEQFGGDNR